MPPIVKPSAIALLMIAGQTHAAGFQLAEQSATGLGRAFAGEAAIADNASVISRNVAAMTRFNQVAFSGGVIYARPDINIDGSVSGALINGDATAHDIAADEWVPNAYLVIPLNEQWRLGFSATSYFGLGVEMPDDFGGSHFGNVSDIRTVDLGASLAYRINDLWSVGAGLSAIQGEGEVGGELKLGTTKMVTHVKGDGWALGWNLGVLLTPSDDTRVGLSYRHDTVLRLEGDAKGVNGHTPFEDAGYIDLVLPATAELAAFHQLNDKLAIHGSVNWTNWSKFTQLQANLAHNPTLHIKDEYWEDNWRYALGMTYQVTPKWQLRSGVAYDASPVSADRRTISIPDADRLWYSVGTGYQFTPQLTVDLGLTLVDGKEVNVTETMTAPIPSTFSGTSEGNAWLLGAQLSYVF
ncbi:MAG: outer membrane protein transport protein [Aeromonas sp.]